jgi:hypothetical protein
MFFPLKAKRARLTTANNGQVFFPNGDIVSINKAFSRQKQST